MYAGLILKTRWLSLDCIFNDLNLKYTKCCSKSINSKEKRSCIYVEIFERKFVARQLRYLLATKITLMIRV